MIDMLINYDYSLLTDTMVEVAQLVSAFPGSSGRMMLVQIPIQGT